LKRQLYFFTCLLIVIITVTGCIQVFNIKKVNKVGMLTEGSQDDTIWNEMGVHGLQEINKKFEVGTIFKENINEKQKIINAVDDLVDKGVNLIYGHGSYFGKTFVEIAKQYPDVHFVYFNGDHYTDNVTSVQFNSHALGFFAGMIAGKMTTSNHVGAISAYEWQPEIEGFFEGAKYENHLIDVHIDYINDWGSKTEAIQRYEKMSEKHVDVIYPAGDFFSEEIIKQASENNVYAIGFLEDQSIYDSETVLTSTVRDIEKVYIEITQAFNKKDLDGGMLTFDFEDEIVSLGAFSNDIPKKYQKMIHKEIERYKETGLLPYQK